MLSRNHTSAHPTQPAPPARPVRRRRLTVSLTVAVAGLGLILAGCSNADPLDNKASGEASSDTIVIGSQAYYSNEIIAEIYAQALEEEGYEVKREFQIGQREVYMPELESGDIDLIPEYSGNLLQYYSDDADAEGSGEQPSPKDVRDRLADALPDGLQVLDLAEATDQDSYTVTQETADKYDLKTIGDLAKLPGGLKIAANAELEERPYGPSGAKKFYDLEISVTSVEDSGGPLTVGALTDNTVQVANIYTSSPAIEEENLVVLEDPEHMIMPQNVVPVGTDELDEGAVDILNGIQSKLSMDDLVTLNATSVEGQESAAKVAQQWLEENS